MKKGMKGERKKLVRAKRPIKNSVFFDRPHRQFRAFFVTAQRKQRGVLAEKELRSRLARVKKAMTLYARHEISDGKLKELTGMEYPEAVKWLREREQVLHRAELRRLRDRGVLSPEEYKNTIGGTQ